MAEALSLWSGVVLHVLSMGYELCQYVAQEMRGPFFQLVEFGLQLVE